MNSTTSTDFKVGDTAFVPFWVVLEFMDATPPEPFIKGRILSLGLRHLRSPTGIHEVLACDFEIKPNLIAPGLPLEYLIAPADLKDWATKIADWFLTAANNETQTHHSGGGFYTHSG